MAVPYCFGNLLPVCYLLQTVVSQLDGWREDMRQINASLTPGQAEGILPLHQENTAQVHAAMLEIMSIAQEQIQVRSVPFRSAPLRRALSLISLPFAY